METLHAAAVMEKKGEGNKTEISKSEVGPF